MKPSGLRVMNHDETGIERQASPVAPVVLQKNFEILRPRLISASMQRIVEGFGDLEKFRAAFHHLPARVQSEFPHQW